MQVCSLEGQLGITQDELTAKDTHLDLLRQAGRAGPLSVTAAGGCFHCLLLPWGCTCHAVAQALTVKGL